MRSCALCGVRIARVHQSDARIPTDPDRLRLEPHVHARPLRPRRARAAERRFFLSGFLRKLDAARHHRVDDGHVLHRAAGLARTSGDASSQRAGEVLRRTGESVYLSPEGGRITTGDDRPLQQGRVPPRDRVCARRSCRCISTFRTRSIPASAIDAQAGHGGRLRAAGDRHHRLDGERTSSRTRNTCERSSCATHQELRCA